MERLSDKDGVARSRIKLRKDKIARARARIAAGHYDDIQTLETILSKPTLDSILAEIDAIPVGDGDAYRDTTAILLTRCLGVVDGGLSQTELQCEGGRVDIELPLRIEELRDRHLWAHWCRRYNADSIIVEVKNEKNRTDFEAASQASAYLELAGRGKLAFIVSRTGFSKNNLKQLSRRAKMGETLIIPLTHDDLHYLAKMQRKGSRFVDRFLRRKQTLLLRGTD